MTRRASRGVALFIQARMTRSGLWKPFCMRCERGEETPRRLKKKWKQRAKHTAGWLITA